MKNRRKKILIFDRYDSNLNPGGDTIQICEIKYFLEEQGHEVIVINKLYEDIESFDIALIFNLTRHQEALINAINCIENKVPYIVFPIYWNLTELKIPAYDLKSLFKNLMPSKYIDNIISLKSFHFDNHISNYNKLMKKYIDKIYDKNTNIQFVLDNAKYICPNSNAEKEHLSKYYKVNSNKTKVIYNGVKKDLYKLNEKKHKNKDIICIGGIGARKNQLGLAKASENSKIKVKLIGKSYGANESYCKKVSKYNNYVELVGWCQYNEVLNLMSKSYGHIQPSFIETPGLASMEAYILGCKVIVSDVSPVREYFNDRASYINPYSLDSINDGLKLLNNYEYKPDYDSIRDFNDKFAWNNVLKDLCELIN